MTGPARRLLPRVLALALLLAPAVLHAQTATLIAGGDVEWSRITRAPTIYEHPPRQEEGGWLQVPYSAASPESRAWLEAQGRTLETDRSHHIRALKYGLTFDTPEAMARYPFREVAPVLRAADLAFVNLETPLSDDARHSGAFRTPTAFADGLRWAGIDVVATANNHALDAEGEGLMDTREALARAGVCAVGTGADLHDARRPCVFERNGVRVAFLGYAQFVNGGNDAFATPDRSGVAPLDPFLIEEDIAAVRDQVDIVVLSFHWGIENSQDTHADARAFAQRMVDAGADVILGHHPHVPRGVEVYRPAGAAAAGDGGAARGPGVILYSMGNLIFGHNHDYWMDNYLARLTLGQGGVQRVEILPVAGRGMSLSQPSLLAGPEARAVLEDIQTRTAALDTRMEIEGAVGVIRP